MPGLITIDASDIKRIGRQIANGAAQTPRGIENSLTRIGNRRLAALRTHAPGQTRLDPRHPIKLRDSFAMRSIRGERTITTETPNKVAFLLTGTAPHMIKPLFKKALWWPGLANPVAYVQHPGTRPNDFISKAWSNYGGGDDDEVRRLADSIVITMLNRGASMTVPMEF